MKKLVDIVSKDDSVIFSSDGKDIKEERVMPLIEKKIADMNLLGEDGILVYLQDEKNCSLIKGSIEAFSAPYSSILFSSGGSRVSNKGAWRMIKEDAFLYLKRMEKGSLFYIPKEEYKTFSKRNCY